MLVPLDGDPWLCWTGIPGYDGRGSLALLDGDPWHTRAAHLLHAQAAGPLLAGPHAAVALADEVVDAVRMGALALQHRPHLREGVPRQPPCGEPIAGGEAIYTQRENQLRSRRCGRCCMGRRTAPAPLRSARSLAFK
eukprot:3593425-Pyramimonas_sp.AAC.1